MANRKITQLPVVGAITGAELFEVVQGGVSRRANLSALLSPAFLVAASTTIVPAARTLAGESGVISLTDNGAGNTFEIAIAASGVSNAKLADMAQATVKGRAAAAGTGAPTDLSAGQLASILEGNLIVALDDLSDVTLTALGDGEVLVSSGGNFINRTLAEAGIANLADTGEQTFQGDIVVQGDLTVQGTVTYINTTELQIGDNIITLNADETGAPSMNAGIEIERGTSDNVAIRWNEATDIWELTVNGTDYFEIISADTVPEATPGGMDTYVQYNNGGAFGGDANFTWDDSLQQLKITGAGSDVGNNPILFFNSTGADPDLRIWGIEALSSTAGNTQLLFARYDDTFTYVEEAMRFFDQQVGFDYLVNFFNDVLMDGTTLDMAGGVITDSTGTVLIDVDLTVEGELLATLAASGSNYPIHLSSNTPLIAFNENDAAADEKVWDFGAAAEQFFLRTRTDAYGSGVNVVVVTRGTGTAIAQTTINGGAEVQIDGTLIDINGAADFSSTITAAGNIIGTGDQNFSAVSVRPRMTLIETGVTAENTSWDISANVEKFELRVLNDALTLATSFMVVERTAQTIDEIEFNATLFDFNGAMDVSGVVTGPAGSASSPAYSFTGDPNTGMYNVSGDVLGFATNGTLRMSVSSGEIDLTSTLIDINGNVDISGTLTLGGNLITAGTLTIAGTGETLATFADDGAVTLYFDNTNRLATSSSGVTVNGVLTASQFNSPAGDVFVSNGDPSNPSHSFSGDADTGMYRAASNVLGFSAGENPVLQLNLAGAIGISDGVGGIDFGTAGQVLTSQGSGAAPTWETP